MTTTIKRAVEKYGNPVSPALVNADFINTYVPEQYRDDIRACLCTRGKRKGKLLKSKPTNCSSSVAAAYDALASTLNPALISVWSYMSGDTEYKTVRNSIEEWITNDKQVIRWAIGYLQSPNEFNVYPNGYFETARMSTIVALCGTDSEKAEVQS